MKSFSARRHAQLRGWHDETTQPVEHEGKPQHPERELTVSSPSPRAQLNPHLKRAALPVPGKPDRPRAVLEVRTGRPRIWCGVDWTKVARVERGGVEERRRSGAEITRSRGEGKTAAAREGGEGKGQCRRGEGEHSRRSRRRESRRALKC